MKVYPEINFDFRFIGEEVWIMFRTIILFDKNGDPIEYRDRFQFSADNMSDMVDSLIKATNHFHFIAQKHIKEWDHA